MNFLLEADSSDPLYRRVRRAIEQAVARGQYRTTPLPSSRALAAELGVSRTTVNLAYQELITEGFIVSEPRVGYRVNADLLSRLDELGAPDPARVAGDGTVDWTAHLRERSTPGLPEVSKDYDWQRYPYPFIYGQVQASAFPVAAWNRALRTAMQQPHITYSLRDAGSADDPLLVDEICTSILPARGVRAEPEQVLVTAGAQHGLFLASQALLRRDELVAVENPGYPDASHIFARAGAKICPVDVDGSGLRVSDVPDDARIVFVTPSHQFPTNVSLGVARRAQLLDHVHANDTFVLEDDFDSELRYVGQPGPALRASGSERVIYIGSFSKFLAPGLRIGFVVAEAPLITQMRRDRRYSLRHLPGQVQRALALMIGSGDYHRTLRRHRSTLREKWHLMGQGVRSIRDKAFEPPTGGTSMWVPLPEGLDSDDVVRRAARRGLLIETGSTCFYDDRPDRHSYLRLGFAAIPLNRIEPGLHVLERVIRDSRPV
jgi:GntR family transcriptional regulator/MocR family aminotransferase